MSVDLTGRSKRVPGAVTLVATPGGTWPSAYLVGPGDRRQRRQRLPRDDGLRLLRLKEVRCGGPDHASRAGQLASASTAPAIRSTTPRRRTANTARAQASEINPRTTASVNGIGSIS